MIMKYVHVVVVCLTLAFIANSAEAVDPEMIDVGAFIDRVIQGEDFAGQEILLSGIALGVVSSGDRLVNIGTQETYNSGAYENFVSVYDVASNVKKGSSVVMLVTIESSSAYKLGGKAIVLIEAMYQVCRSC